MGWVTTISTYTRLNERMGRSLLEVLIVLGIVGITALMTGEAFWGGSMTNRLAAVKKNIALELRIARQWAVIRREPISVRFDVGGSHARTERFRQNGRPLRQYDFSKKGIVVKSLSKGFHVVFYPSGRTATPTTILLQDRRGQQVALTVSLTGRVRMN